jgi:hypothetical protein
VKDSIASTPLLGLRSCFFDPISKKNRTVDGPIKQALLLWRSILREGSPRPIPNKIGGPADAIICTDGFTPGPFDKDQSKPPRVGGVIFTKWRKAAIVFSSKVSQDIIDTWLPRKTQIAQIELLAMVAAFDTFGSELSGKRVIALIDNESALGAAIKGYSRVDDVSHLVTRLWEIINRHSIIVYFDRISTDANISDGPSRDDWSVARDAEWKTQHIELPRY